MENVILVLGGISLAVNSWQFAKWTHRKLIYLITFRQRREAEARDRILDARHRLNQARAQMAIDSLIHSSQ